MSVDLRLCYLSSQYENKPTIVNLFALVVSGSFYHIWNFLFSITVFSLHAEWLGNSHSDITSHYALVQPKLQACYIQDKHLSGLKQHVLYCDTYLH